MPSKKRTSPDEVARLIAPAGIGAISWIFLLGLSAYIVGSAAAAIQTYGWTCAFQYFAYVFPVVGTLFGVAANVGFGRDAMIAKRVFATVVAEVAALVVAAICSLIVLALLDASDWWFEKALAFAESAEWRATLLTGSAELAILIIAALLFRFRLRWRACYGVTEALVGLLIAPQKLHNLGGTSLMLALLTASVYLVVRGFDNVHQGLTKEPRDAWATAIIGSLSRRLRAWSTGIDASG